MRILRIAIPALLLAVTSQAAYHYVHYPSRSVFTPIFEKFDLTALPNNTVTFFVADEGPNTYGADTPGSVLSQIRQAAAAWNSVDVSDLRVAFGGLEQYTDSPTTSRPGASIPAASTPGADVIFIDTPGVLGLGAPTISTTPVKSASGETFYPIVRGLVMISRDTTSAPWPSASEGFFTTAVHEIGHALGLQHTWTGSAMSQGVIRTTSRARPLDADDIASLAELYGKANWQSNYGSIGGHVTFAASGQGVSLASVVAISPTGPAVGALTNPDGSYRIDGLPAGFSYNVYVHPLPPDALAADDSGLRRPVDPNGAPFNASAPFQTIFYSGTVGTLDPAQASLVPISGGSALNSVNFTVQPRSAVTTYNVQTYSRIDTAARAYGHGSDLGDASIVGYPGFMDSTQPSGFVVVQAASPALLPVPKSVAILGNFPVANTIRGNYPTIWPYSDTPGDFIALYFLIPANSGTGPRHLVFNFGNDIYVLPSGVELVKQGPPVATAATANGDGTVTISGAGFGYDSRVFFDGLQAAQGSYNPGDGSLTVTPPAGANGQTAAVTVYNSDGQNSTILPGATTPTYSYGASAPQIGVVSPSALPAGATAMVDITASGTNFVDGQVTVGFGSDDVQVRRVWVLSPTHLVANVAVAANAAPGLSEVSIVAGMQVASQPNGFQIQPARSGAPVVATVVPAFPMQPGLFAGNWATIYGQNFTSSTSAVQITLNDVAVSLISFASPNQINFFVPPGFATGPAVLKVTANGVVAFPVVMQVDAPPPVITNVSAATAGAGDVLQVTVAGLDPAIAANSQGRLKVTIAGMQQTVQQISPAQGAFQIQVAVNQSFGASPVPLAVWVDGIASAPFTVVVR